MIHHYFSFNLLVVGFGLGEDFAPQKNSDLVQFLWAKVAMKNFLPMKSGIK